MRFEETNPRSKYRSVCGATGWIDSGEWPARDDLGLFHAADAPRYRPVAAGDLWVPVGIFELDDLARGGVDSGSPGFMELTCRKTNSHTGRKR